MLRIKRIYASPEKSDGRRVLVMRLWPRGVRRGRVDEWNREVAPSRELLFAFKRGGLPWKEYVRRYWKEIRPEAVDALRRRARRETITLLCSCEDETHCHRGLLRDAVLGKRGREESEGSVKSIRPRASTGTRARGARLPARRGGRPAARS